MKKVRDFFKNYHKILIVSLIGIIVVMACSLLLHHASLCREVDTVNNRQLIKVYDKSVELTEQYYGVFNAFSEPEIRDMTVLYRFLKLEPDDIYDAGYLTKCCNNLAGISNLIVLDAERKPVFSVGQLRNIDYSKPYYDSMLAIPEGECAEIPEEGKDGLRSFAIPCNEHYLITQAERDTSKFYEIPECELWRMAEMTVGIDSNSDFAVIDTADNSVIYTDSQELKNGVINTVTSANGTTKTEDGRFFVQYYDVDEGGEGRRLLALTPSSILANIGRSDIVLAGALFLVIMIVLVSFIICLREDELDSKQEYKALNKYFLHSQTKKFKALAILLGILMVFVYAFVSSFNASKFDLKYLESESDKCIEAYGLYARNYSELTRNRNDMMFGYGKVVSDFTVKHEDYLTKEGMGKLADAIDSEYLTVTDAEGQTVCTSSPLDNLNILDDPESPLYELKEVLVGKEGVLVRINQDDIEDNANIYGVPRRGADGVADGMVAITTEQGVTNSASTVIKTNAENIIESLRANYGTVAFLVDNYGVVVSDMPIESGDSVVDESTMKNNYCGVININGKSFLASVTYMEFAEQYIYVITPVKWFSSSTLISTVVLALIYIILALWMWYDGLGSKFHFESRKRKIKDADEWERTELNWDELTISKKMGKIISVCIYAFSILIIIMQIIAGQGLIDDSLKQSILSSNWNTSVNGFSIMVNACLVCLFYTAIKFIEYILKKIEGITAGDGETVCRLFSSFIKYIGALFCAYVIVTNFGVNATAAIASIGIVGLALTFGAQELIKDMISGMFILFEGNFKVGDMLDVDGDWYWIKSIGVRTTTLEAWGTVKVINNSQMTGIVNIQNASEVVNCDVWIGKQYDIKEVEAIMKKELPALKEEFTADVSTPVWKGIQEITASGTLIRLRTYCPPLAQGRVGRMLRSKVKSILDSHGIELAYEAYVIHAASINSEEIQKEIADSLQGTSSDMSEDATKL